MGARAAALSLNVTVGGQERALKGSRDALAVSNPDLLEYLQMRAILSTKATSKLSVPQPPATGEGRDSYAAPQCVQLASLETFPVRVPRLHQVELSVGCDLRPSMRQHGQLAAASTEKKK